MGVAGMFADVESSTLCKVSDSVGIRFLTPCMAMRKSAFAVRCRPKGHTQQWVGLFRGVVGEFG